MRLHHSIPRFCTLITAFLIALAAGRYISQIEATFQSLPFADGRPYVLSLDVHAVELSPGPDPSLLIRWVPAVTPSDSSPASALRSLQLESATDSWQRLRLELPRQAENQSLVLRL
ncbi:MAG: hypothetical protein RLZZ399_2057 [Verrucomicrobiota bacterium]|jgi:hypothetical protein